MKLLAMRSRKAAPSRSRGVAALTMVMVLFFVMAMVAAYTNRNLLYEQRMSVNNFRATAALSAADAGIDWTVALLSGGRIDANCDAPAAPAAADLDFRSRYTILQADGSYNVPKWGPAADKLFSPSCVLTDAGWSCKCPNAADPTPALNYPANSAPIFAVELTAVAGTPGLLRVDAFGSHESSREMSFGTFGNYNRVRVNLGLARALPVPPVAALTAGNTITMNGANALTVSNADASTGVAIHAGNGVVSDPAQTTLRGPAGSVNDARLRIDADAPLLSLSTTSSLFQSIFGMDAGTYSRQPAAAFIDCTAGCTSASITTAVTNSPGRVLWIDGDINLNGGGTLGTAAQPVMLVASGDVTVSAPIVVNGFIYGRDVIWQAGAGGSAVLGAVVASRNFIGNDPVIVAYDAAIMQRISLSYGSFVKVPGSWQIVPTR